MRRARSHHSEQAIETGTVTISNQRVVFQGSQQAREWTFSKLLGSQHNQDAPWTAIQVSNRQKVSGFLYDEANAHAVRFRLTPALANFHNRLPEMIQDLEHQIEEHRSVRPALPPDRPVAGAPRTEWSLARLVLHRLRFPILALLTLFALSSTGHAVVEHYSRIDAAYMTFITLSTVGFGEVRQLHKPGRLLTMGRGQLQLLRLGGLGADGSVHVR